MQKPTLLRRLRRALWFATAGLVILAAVLLTLLRLLLPGLEDYRAQVEARASMVLGQPVRIKTLSSRLDRLSPVAVLEEVVLLDPAGGQPVARFREVGVGLDVWASARRLRPVMSTLTVAGADLTVLRHPDGSVQVQGLAGGGGDEARPEGIGRWLLEQGRLALQDSRLRWRDLKNGHSLDFEQVEIALHNRGQRHQLNVEVALPPGMGRSLRLTLDLEGDVLRPGAWSGRGYVEGTALRPAQWLAEWGPLAGFSLEQGVFDLRLWGEWEAGGLAQAQGLAEVHDLAVRSEVGALALHRLAGAAHWQRLDDGWQLGLEGVRLLPRADSAAEPLTALLRRDAAGWQVQSSTVQLEDAAAIAALLPQLAGDQRELLAALAPRGRLRDLRLAAGPDGALQVQGSLERGALQPWQKLPGFTGLSGHWVWDGAQGYIALDSRDATLNFARLFRQPLVLKELRGTAAVARDADGWRLDLGEVRAVTPDISTTVDATLTLPEQDSPYLDLRGSFRDGRAAATPRYLPAGIMGKEALAWLDQAFRAGNVVSGGVLFHGPLAAFPFDQGEGRFEVDFQARGVELFLRTGWPALRQVDARVRFLNRSLVIDAGRGSMYDSRVHGARVAIDDLHRPLLQVRGTARLSGDDAFRVLRDTPLRAQVGDYVTGLRLEGDSELELEFDLPLVAALAQSRPFRLAGAVTLYDNRLWIEEQLPIEAIAGRLAFTGQGLQADDLSARILDAPASVVIYEEGSGAHARTVIAGRGRFQAAALRRLHASPLLAHLSGASDWQGLFTLPRHGSDDPVQLWLRSDLDGIGSELPHPLAKAAEEKRVLELVHHFTGPRRGELDLSYGEELRTILALEEGGALQRGAVHFGTGAAALPVRDELHVSGVLRELDLGRWGEALRGEGDGDRMGLPLRVEMDELHLAAGEEEEDAAGRQRPAAEGGTLPPMEVRIARFGYGTAQLEQLAFRLHGDAESMRLSELTLSGPAMTVSGQARWQRQPRSYSEMKLHLESPDVGRMLAGLGVASVITRGEASAEAELHWSAPLHQFDRAILGGTLRVDIADGMMEEVEPGAGRLLGLLSLQALPRRLILDFRDLFQKGLAFSRIEGDISLRGGNAYTSNLTLQSSAALMRVEGRTGLVARDYDQRITVVPNLSGTAPVVGALAFGPQVGAVMLVFQRLLQKNIDEAARSEYRVTGSWDEPLIEKAGSPDVPTSALDSAAL